MCITFEWDEDKATKNLKKHGIDFSEAARALLDPWRQEHMDDKNHVEDRFTMIGALKGQPLFVVYTVRDDCLRLISAREATRHEAIYYWKNRPLRP